MSDIIPVNSSDGFTPYLIGFYVNTEHGWVGAYDKRAIESMIAAVREKALHEAAIEINRLRAERDEARKLASEWSESAGGEIARLHADNQAAVTAYATEITEAKSEIERLRADAGRYRWLRDKSPTGFGDFASTRSGGGVNPLEQVIDAAMKKDLE